MPELCEHLSAYGDAYRRTTANYQVCLDLMDRILNRDPNPSLPGSLERSLNEWEMENRRLRELFVSQVHKGRILLPRVDGELLPPGAGGADSVCAVCAAPVPRVAFTEWTFAEDGAVWYRGQEIAPAPAAPETDLQPV